MLLPGFDFEAGTGEAAVDQVRHVLDFVRLRLTMRIKLAVARLSSPSDILIDQLVWLVSPATQVGSRISSGTVASAATGNVCPVSFEADAAVGAVPTHEGRQLLAADNPRFAVATSACSALCGRTRSRVALGR
jgi:hypothetical protein